MDHLEEFFEKIITVKLSPDKKAVNIIDQTLLPGEIKRIDLRTGEEIHDAIKRLKVRGAPAIGVTAAYGMAVLSAAIDADGYEDFYREFISIKNHLASSRPTAVNLFWALNRMEKCLVKNRDKALPAIVKRLYEEAEEIRV